MKKNLLIAIFAVIAVFANAQVCTPDSQYTTSGVFPDSATGLPDAYVNHLYSEIITVVVPTDTTGTVGGFTVNAHIDSIDVENWNDPGYDAGNGLNLPNNGVGATSYMAAACEPPGCHFPGGTKGCLLVTGLVNVVADTGTFQLNVKTTAYTHITTAPLTGQAYNQATTISYYSITVRPDSSGNGIQFVKSNEFQVMQNNPNPFMRSTNIVFSNNKSGKVVFTVYNMLGEIVRTETIASSEGTNRIQFNSNELPSGIYSYSINNGDKTISKRMILAEK